MVRLAVAGLGDLGKHHCGNIRWSIPNAGLAAVYTRSRQTLDRYCSAHDVPSGTTDYEDLLDRSDIDAVVIATPVSTHSDMIIRALRKGKHVFCEKPMGMTPQEAARVQQEAEAHPELVCMTGFMRRFDPSYLSAKKRIESGAIGKPFMYRGYSLDKDMGPESAPERINVNGIWYTEMLVHDIDLARWFLGSDVVNVRAIGGCYKYPVYGEYGDIDNACTIMEFADRSMAMFFTGRTAPHGSHVETEIIGTEGMIRINPIPVRDRITWYGTQGVSQECVTDYLERFGEAFRAEVQEFASCIEHGTKPQMTPYDSRRVTEIADAAYQAYVTNSMVSCKGDG